MSEAEFRKKRRQKFLTEKYFQLNRTLHAMLTGIDAETIERKRQEGRFDSSSQGSLFKGRLKLLRLHYTAGEPIETLKPLYAEVMTWFGEWHLAYAVQVKALANESGEALRTDGSPLYFEDLSHFQLALDVVSLGILLGEAGSVLQAAAWMARYRGTDMLMEFLLERIVDDPRDIEEFFHEDPYDPLLDAIYTAETPEESQAFMHEYLDGWYKAFEGVPWHNGHLVVTEEYSAYEGYWAFEAAAVCILLGLDDTPFRDHMVYPKDLADWARAHNVLKAIAPEAGALPLRQRCLAGQPCPKAGYWMTPAKLDSRRMFKQGEVMPDLDSNYGATIWQWDEQE